MITLKIGGVDYTSQISQESFQVQEIIDTMKNTCTFVYKKYGSKSYVPQMFDVIEVDDADGPIFAGRISQIVEDVLSVPDGILYTITAADWTLDLDNLMVSKIYENMDCHDIIADMVDNFAPGFTYANVQSGATISKIVFNLIPMSECIKKLATVVSYYWYIDTDKDIHFFNMYANTAPFNLSDNDGKYVKNSLERTIDGSQVANQVIVQGGKTDAATFTDSVTINGDSQTSVILPYQFDPATLTIKRNGGTQTVGIFGQDNFPDYDVLYNYTTQSIAWASALTDGDIIEFSGKPIIDVMAINSDPDSIAAYGTRQKIISENSIVDIMVARQRAVAEIIAYKDPISTITFDTIQPGLRVGQVINLKSTLRGCDINFLIKQVTFNMRRHNTFLYHIEAVTVRTYTLTEILAKLMLPSNLGNDSNITDNTSITDLIKNDVATISIAENIFLKTPITIDAVTVTITESINKDPIGAGVIPIFVLGPYFPSSPADTKRVGLLDNSLIVY